MRFTPRSKQIFFALNSVFNIFSCILGECFSRNTYREGILLKSDNEDIA